MEYKLAYMRKRKLRCHCGEPAEVKWKALGQPEHLLCSNCMSEYWNIITDKYKGSKALECSVFEAVNQ